MRAKTFCAAVAGALLAPATPAAADEPVSDCHLAAVPVAGMFTGLLSGYVVHPSGGSVRVTCRLWVDAAPVCTTPTGTGEAAATTAAPCVFLPGATYRVETYVTTTHGSVQVWKAWHPLQISCGGC